MIPLSVTKFFAVGFDFTHLGFAYEVPGMLENRREKRVLLDSHRVESPGTSLEFGTFIVWNPMISTLMILAVLGTRSD